MPRRNNYILLYLLHCDGAVHQVKQNRSFLDLCRKPDLFPLETALHLSFLVCTTILSLFVPIIFLLVSLSSIVYTFNSHCSSTLHYSLLCGTHSSRVSLFPAESLSLSPDRYDLGRDDSVSMCRMQCQVAFKRLSVAWVSSVSFCWVPIYKSKTKLSGESVRRHYDLQLGHSSWFVFKAFLLSFFWVPLSSSKCVVQY